MKKIASILTIVMTFAVVCVTYASQPSIMPVSQTSNALYDAVDNKKAMDEAIRSFLDKNPPEIISASLYSIVEKSLPASLPESAREKALRHIRENVTPDIMKRMISAGLRRNFTVNEISVLAEYDESQFSDELKKKNEAFRYEISSEIRLLLAATI